MRQRLLDIHQNLFSLCSLVTRVTETKALPSQRLHFPAQFQVGDYVATNGTRNTSQVCPSTFPFLPAGIRLYIESAVSTTQIRVALGDNEITRREKYGPLHWAVT